MIKPGKYTAKIKDYGIGETKAKEPNIMILFGFEDGDGTQQELLWRGSLKEGKAREITLDALLVCGMKTNELADLSQGNGSGALDQTKDVQISIEHETYEGKTHARVKYINEPGGRAFGERMDQDNAIKRLGGMNLGGDLMARREAKGYKAESTKPTAQATMSAEDVPF